MRHTHISWPILGVSINEQHTTWSVQHGDRLFAHRISLPLLFGPRALDRVLSWRAGADDRAARPGVLQAKHRWRQPGVGAGRHTRGPAEDARRESAAAAVFCG